MTDVIIKENSILAKMAARKLETESVAMVVGRTIHLHNSSREEFLKNKRWLRHELAHVKQYKRLGLLRFIFYYLLESFNKGYYNNSFEVEARQKERDAGILAEFNIT